MTQGNKHDAIQGEIVHVYDGIEEADNRLPRWWLWTFYIAIAFSFGYWVYYESFAIGAGPLDRFTQDRMAALDTGEPVTDEVLVALAADKLAVRAGGKAFAQNCAKCHGSRAEGNIGPNLTDDYWLADDDPAGVYATISAGRTGKGMPAWGLQLGPGACKQIAAYLITVRGSNLPGKPPQGEKRPPRPLTSAPPAARPPAVAEGAAPGSR